jgi:hypothetical protein
MSMQGPQFRKRFVLHALIMGAFLTAVSHGGGWCQTNDSGSMNEKRLEPQDVTMANREEYEAQLRRDLPIGTAKRDVEAYLTRQGITHSFAGRGALVDENTVYAILKNIGQAGPFVASLAIRIQLDADDKVARIWFRVDYL